MHGSLLGSTLLCSPSSPLSAVHTHFVVCLDRWFGLLLASYRAKRTTWLAITWTVLFFLAIGLLIGLLVGEHSCT